MRVSVALTLKYRPVRQDKGPYEVPPRLDDDIS